MALDRQILKQDIVTLLNDLKDNINQQEAIQKYAEDMSLAIHNYITSATVIGTTSEGASIVDGQIV